MHSSNRALSAEHIEATLRRAVRAAIADHRAHDVPISYADRSMGNALVREYPDGRRVLLDEHAHPVRELAPRAS
jgi:hypothetical protein